MCRSNAIAGATIEWGGDMSDAWKTAPSALVVDDEPALLSLLEDVLVDAGFETTCFGRGAPALDALAQRRFDLLVVDIGLPDTNGMRICEVARQRYGDEIAILIITADNRKERCITAFELGADDFVPKPFDLDELMMRITVILRRTASFSA
jgi:DNA-binding response OmpR family regulator